jgi:hypothetical protein
MTGTYSPGALVRARGRDWVVMTPDEADVIRLRPVDGGFVGAGHCLPVASLPSLDASSLPEKVSQEILSEPAPRRLTRRRTCPIAAFGLSQAHPEVGLRDTA